jgi:hypothetical protein
MVRFCGSHSVSALCERERLLIYFRDDKAQRMRYSVTMITVATSYYWYFSFDSSLAAGGSRSI